jgi:hypothetical protein
MKTNIGLWIDQRKAVVVLGSGESIEIRIVHSHADRQPGRSDGVRSIAPYEALSVEADDVSRRKFTQEMGHSRTPADNVLHSTHLHRHV